MKRINFVVPVKSLEQSKMRLSGVLSPECRIHLVSTLLKKNLAKLRHFFSAHNILVVTPDQQVAALARSYGAKVLLEIKQVGLDHAVEMGTRWSINHGYKTQMVIFPDIAHLDVIEVCQLLKYTSEPRHVTICVAKDRGTNAILTTPPNIIPLRYGRRSSENMAIYAKKKGVPCTSLYLPHLAFDIDTPEDLSKYSLVGGEEIYLHSESSRSSDGLL